MNPVKESVAVQNPLVELHNYGQSIWLDYIRRSLITSGGLKRLVDEDGLRGVTSNPTIFDKAIADSDDYDDSLRAALRANPDATPMALFDAIEIEDIQMAADVLRPVYDSNDGGDGFVSIEVSPAIARDTAETLSEARRLWKAVNRPNLMIKVPATPEGIPAITTLISEGINVNITLMFSMKHYEAVANAYIEGLEKAKDPRRIASVASFFVSRVDTLIDKELDKIGTPEALALRGKIAIANSKMVYQRFRELFSGPRWEKLAKRGAHVQRPLWASTGTKNPQYSDVLYVETLIGRDTVNTLPPATMDAFRDHGRVRETVTENLDEARDQIARLEKLGINLEKVGDKLQDDGVELFADSLKKLLESLEEKRGEILATSARK
jgi:transaldolase